MTISSLFIRRPRLAFVVSTVITIAGIIAMTALPVAQFPDIVPPQVRVTATYPGASAQAVEESVAQVIEAQVNGVARMKKDPAIEHRIQNEIVVDADGEHERHGAWMVYLEERLTFPFAARCVERRPESLLAIGEGVTVTGWLEADEPESE